MKLADVSIRRPVLATVMVGTLLVFGLVAYPKIGVDLFPNVDFPFVTVTAVYPGADPESIESKVVDKLEEAINTINGIKMLRSTSTENVGLVVVQFELERDVDQCVQDVRDKVSGVQRDLPPDLEPPVVAKFDIGAAPIMALALAGPQSVRELTRVADDVIKERIQTLDGVGGIDIVGGQQREFHVWLDPLRLASFGLAVSDVAQALMAQNVEIPGGRIDVGRLEFAVKTKGQVHSAAELNDIVITAAAGAPVRIRDVARVEDGEEEARSYSSLNGQAAVALIVRKQSGANTVQVAQAVRTAVAMLRPELPKGMTLSIPDDNSTFISNSIHDVQIDLVIGAILAIIIILFFLHDWRATFISALALPTSVIATFAFVQAMDFTFNTMTMLALSLAIGILIDDAIVVIESIHRHLEMGKSPKQAASEATAEIGLAVLATTASIVAVFVPVATMKGIIGRMFLQFGLTVAFAVSVSLFVAFTLTPTLSARLLKTNHGRRKNPIARGIDWLLGKLDRVYRALLGLALRQRVLTLIVAVMTLAASVYVARFVSFEFLPPDDRGEFVVNVERTAGTQLDEMKRYVEAVSQSVRAVPGVASALTTIGGGAQGEVQRAQVKVNLVPRAERAFTQTEAMAYIRSLFSGRSEATFAVEPVGMIGGSAGFREAAVQFIIQGRDYEQLNRAAQELIAALRTKGGYVDLDTTYRGGKPEVSVTIDRDRAADLNVPIVTIAMTIRTLFAGDKASELVTDGDRFDVRLRMDERYRRQVADILNLNVRAQTGALVPLWNIVSVTPGQGPAKIERQARQRQVTILANLEGKTLGDAMTEIDALASQKLPASLQTSWTGMGDVMQESVGYLLEALLLAIIIIYLILAAQFESFVHPFTIMLSLPLAVVGALGALAVTGMTMNIMTMIGIIMLMGLVTKNAILLVDYANTLRSRGLSTHEALLEAGPVRLRPILMTTAAMIFGMIPVALALSEGGEMRAPMAVAVIGGLITSTLLTLLVVPVVYSLLDGLARRLSRKKGPAAAKPAGAHAAAGAPPAPPPGP